MFPLHAFFFAYLGFVFVGINLADSCFDLFPYLVLVNQEPFMPVQVRVKFFYSQRKVSRPDAWAGTLAHRLDLHNMHCPYFLRYG